MSILSCRGGGVGQASMKTLVSSAGDGLRDDVACAAGDAPQYAPAGSRDHSIGKPCPLGVTAGPSHPLAAEGCRILVPTARRRLWSLRRTRNQPEQYSAATTAHRALPSTFEPESTKPRVRGPGASSHVREGGVEPAEYHARSRWNDRPERGLGLPLSPVCSRYLGVVHPRGAPASVELRPALEAGHPILCPSLSPARDRWVRSGQVPRTTPIAPTSCSSPDR